MNAKNVPSKWDIAQHWYSSPNRSTLAPCLVDLGEPCCFACSWYSERWDKGTPQASWQRATLDRAHIVPSSLGGSDDLDNLILLCAPCHKESPDWSNSSAMERWIATRPARSSKEMEDVEAWNRAATEVPEFAELAELRASLEPEQGQEIDDHILSLLRESRRHASLHWGVGLSQGTRVAVIRQVAEHASAAHRVRHPS